MRHDSSSIIGLALLASSLPLHLAAQDAQTWGDFLRGDANSDRRLDISDPVLILQELFIQGGLLLCPDSLDADDSGRVDISDPIRTLMYLFAGENPPPPPFPEPGPDPSEDGLSCVPGWSDQDSAEPLPASEIEALLGTSEQITELAATMNAIEVSGETFDLLARLPDGASLLDYLTEPGVPELMERLGAMTRPAGSPVAIPSRLTVPMGPDGCYEIDSGKLQGESRDLGDNPTPAGELKVSVDPPVVCGAGEHVVEVSVTDAEGKSSQASTMVTLCMETDCQEVIEQPGTPGGTNSQYDMMCAWILTKHIVPPHPIPVTRGRYFDTAGRFLFESRQPPFLIGENPLEAFTSVNGTGPFHKLMASRFTSHCTTPATEFDLLGSGIAILRLNVVCFTSNDCALILDPPCQGTVDVEGSYQSRVVIYTDAGPDCRNTNSVEALAQDEATLAANDRYLFGKAVTVQNGNQISKNISYQLGGNWGVGPTGPAANFMVQFGLGQSVTQALGLKKAELNAFGTTRVSTPATARLSAEGRAELDAKGRAGGFAGAVTRAVAIYVWGYSNCPGAHTAADMFARGSALDPDALKTALDLARGFFFQRTGSHRLFEGLRQ